MEKWRHSWAQVKDLRVRGIIPSGTGAEAGAGRAADAGSGPRLPQSEARGPAAAGAKRRNVLPVGQAITAVLLLAGVSGKSRLLHPRGEPSGPAAPDALPSNLPAELGTPHRPAAGGAGL